MTSRAYSLARAEILDQSPSLYTNTDISSKRSEFKIDGNIPLSNTSRDTRLDSKNTVKDSNINGSTDQVPLEIGNFESPVLQILSKRTINKELESNRIITNILFIALWNLFSKFFTFFTKYTKFGKYINFKIIWMKLSHWNWSRKYNSYFYNNKFLYNTFSFNTLNWLVLIISFYNILLALYRLSTNIKIDDLHLNDKQKKLLGLKIDNNIHTNNLPSHNLLHINKSIIHSDSNNLTSTSTSTSISTSASASTNTAPPSDTPYLFKSMQTPSKTKALDTNNRFSPGNNSNIFSKNNSLFKTPSSKTSYIPSSKYTYRMGSPSRY